MNLRETIAAFEENLALERELGTRMVEFDRALLSPLRIAAANNPAHAKTPAPVPVPVRPAGVSAETPVGRREIAGGPEQKLQAAGKIFSCAFISFKPLSVPGRELLDKMIAAMKISAADAIVTDCTQIAKKGLPNAKICVLLGEDALKALLPGVPVRRGVFNRLGGMEAMCTMSPDFMLRFHANDPVRLKADKMSVWAELKLVMAKQIRN